ncbi:MAG: dihydrodipicolinate synthase family protein [Pseudomonadota bacterium]
MPGTRRSILFRGVWATTLLRIDQTGGIDLQGIQEQTTAFAAAGCQGVYIGGTASEFHALSDSQFEVTSTALAQAATNCELPFQIGASHPLAPGSLVRIGIAARLNPDAIQVTLPDWTPVDLETARRFLERCADAARGIPLLLYNPPQAKTLLDAQSLVALAEQVPALAGLKCGGGNSAWYAAMAPVFDRLSVFIPGHHYHSGTAQGAHGSYSNMACLSPEGAVRWAKLSPDMAADLEVRVALFIQEAITPLLDRGLPGFACDKAMAAAGGWASITPRLLWPFEGASDREVRSIVKAAERHIPEFLAPTKTHV